MNPRYIRPGITYFLTRRCIERRFLLRPSSSTNQIVEYCLAVAAERTGVALHMFCAMSNHVHSVVTDVEGRLPEFLQLFHRNVAIAMNASLGRSENFWAVTQASALELGDADDVLEKMAYVAANPTSAGLVRAPQKWPGVITTRLCESRQVKRPPGFFRANGGMPDHARLDFQLPKHLESMGFIRATERFHQAVAQKVEAARTKARVNRHAFLGAKAVLRTPIADRAATPERTKAGRPRFAIRNQWLRQKALAIRKAFLLAYREAFRQWRDGERDVRFPQGTWMMSRVHRASCGPPELASA